MAAATMVAAPSRQLFLSYAPEDRQRAAELAGCLAEYGHRPWLPDREVWRGDNWAMATGKALEDCDAMVAIISQAAGATREVSLNLSFSLVGQRYERRVVPVVLDGAAHEGIPWVLYPFIIEGKSSDWTLVCAQVAVRLDPAHTARLPD